MTAMTSTAAAEPPTVARTRPMQPTPVHETIATALHSRERSEEMNSLKDKVAIITGAVGNLGTSTARNFQQAGAHTVLVDRSPDRVRDVFKDTAGSTNHLLVGGIDLSNPASLGKLIEQTLSRFGRLGVLVNTVGAFRGGNPVHEADLADWDFLFSANQVFGARLHITGLRAERGPGIDFLEYITPPGGHLLTADARANDLSTSLLRRLI